jgi:hypothetical protein
MASGSAFELKTIPMNVRLLKSVVAVLYPVPELIDTATSHVAL